MSEAGSVRRRRGRVEVEKLVAEYEASGLTREVFCQQRALSVTSLDKYRRRVEKWARSVGGPMLPVEVVLSTGQGSNCAARGYGVLVVESRSGRRIEVARGFDGETLERLLTILDKV
jgi:hypothetical protein